jgi:hypothetical protein
MTKFLLAASVLMCSSALPGQALCVQVSPDPAPVGALITVTCHATSATALFTPNGCLVQSIHSGTPNGPVVRSYFCITIPVQIPGCGTTMPRTATWNQLDAGNVQVPPGLYWFKILHAPSGFSTTTTEWHCVTISGAAPEPVLSAAATTAWGVPFQLTLTAPTHPNEFYAFALSGSTNVGLALSPTLFLCLDQDWIFNLTFPTPDPTVFAGFQGTTDASGNAVGTIFIPPLFLGCFPLHAQAGLVDAGSNVYLSNEIHFTIQ